MLVTDVGLQQWETARVAYKFGMLVTSGFAEIKNQEATLKIGHQQKLIKLVFHQHHGS